MIRVLFFAMIAAAFTFCAMKPALAVSELCPVSFRLAAVDAGSNAAPSLFGFELTAEGPRSVTATMAFDTTMGWFTASIPAAVLREKDLHYDSPTASFIRRTWVSPIMYIKFPTPVVAAHEWVYSAQSVGDDFGWNKMGVVMCHPAAGASFQRPPRATEIVKLDPKDAENLSASPGPASTIIATAIFMRLKQSNCATPFRDATTTRTTPPAYPMMARPPAIDVTSTIEVAINADGSVSDAWVLYPSGFSAFDEATRQAALQSKFQSGVAYCENVPGIYLFKVTFTRNSAH